MINPHPLPGDSPKSPREVICDVLEQLTDGTRQDVAYRAERAGLPPFETWLPVVQDHAVRRFRIHRTDTGEHGDVAISAEDCAQEVFAEVFAALTDGSYVEIGYADHFAARVAGDQHKDEIQYRTRMKRRVPGAGHIRLKGSHTQHLAATESEEPHIAVPQRDRLLQLLRLIASVPGAATVITQAAGYKDGELADGSHRQRRERALRTLRPLVADLLSDG